MTSSVVPLSTNPVVLSYKAIKLVGHDLSLVHLCWLFPLTNSFCVCPEMCSKNTCFMHQYMLWADHLEISSSEEDLEDQHGLRFFKRCLTRFSSSTHSPYSPWTLSRCRGPRLSLKKLRQGRYSEPQSCLYLLALYHPSPHRSVFFSFTFLLLM